ncbi:hypothetical protein VOLCADRAFT_108480 [Volvox carteri f. nagariensis]|uniref:Uncharacterized protein n=1 Tax=Volvox carteri f. nagariensis TaxID=3068 RepID=D8UKD3_VOLCA|nr:uncharacterized protein VOLCADRAFT_108480 [Volvox carteri f. nagariensis]EFJ39819.1 hypothetical protein VOLCADRAFT_108480 [Volvox carteri f. nagariensis]|eukprot:XP_002959120.1 hypothetical protein VOLCADRAFT_108480 [Volvox carteri f. nagariensis]
MTYDSSRRYVDQRPLGESPTGTLPGAQMTSYLSIQNDTDITFAIKLGTDTEAEKWARIFMTVMDKASSVEGLQEPIGVSMDALASLAEMAAVAPGTDSAFRTQVSSLIAMQITKHVKKVANMQLLEPGNNWRSDPMKCGEWLICHCFAARVNPKDSSQVLIGSVYMRPIYSGETYTSINKYNISDWVTKGGWVDVRSIVLPPEVIQIQTLRRGGTAGEDTVQAGEDTVQAGEDTVQAGEDSLL